MVHRGLVGKMAEIPIFDPRQIYSNFTTLLCRASPLLLWASGSGMRISEFRAKKSPGMIGRDYTDIVLPGVIERRQETGRKLLLRLL